MEKLFNAVELLYVIIAVIIIVAWILLPFFVLSRLKKIHHSIEEFHREWRSKHPSIGFLPPEKFD